MLEGFHSNEMLKNTGAIYKNDATYSFMHYKGGSTNVCVWSFVGECGWINGTRLQFTRYNISAPSHTKHTLNNHLLFNVQYQYSDYTILCINTLLVGGWEDIWPEKDTDGLGFLSVSVPKLHWKPDEDGITVTAVTYSVQIKWKPCTR